MRATTMRVSQFVPSRSGDRRRASSLHEEAGSNPRVGLRTSSATAMRDVQP